MLGVQPSPAVTPKRHPLAPRLLQGRGVDEPLEVRRCRSFARAQPRQRRADRRYCSSAQEVDDPAHIRATRAARADPAHAPDEPLLLYVRPFDAPAPPRDAPDDAHALRIIVRRELGTVGDAKAALVEALARGGATSGAGDAGDAGDAQQPPLLPHQVRLVLGGVALEPDEGLLWDAGCRGARTLYWQRVA